MIKYGKDSRKLMKKAIPIYVICIILGVLFVNLANFIQNDSEDEDANYKCEITKDSELSWKYTKVDPILIQNLSDVYNIELIGLIDLGVKEGSIIEYKIEDIEDTDDKWNLEISYQSDEISGEDTKELKIYKDPIDVPNSWIYNIEDLALRILPSETQDYLDEIKDNFQTTEIVDIERDSDFNLIIWHHINFTFVFTEFKYNDKGIIERFTLIFFDSIALEYILEDYSLNDEIDENPNLLKIIIFIVISSIILIMIPLIGYVLSKNNSANKNKNCKKSSELNSLSNRNYIVNQQKKEDIESKHVKPKKTKYLFCELCGTKIDENAIYCHYCGNKLYYSK